MTSRNEWHIPMSESEREWDARMAALAEAVREAHRTMETNAARLERIAGYTAKHGRDTSAVKAIAGVAEDLTVTGIRMSAVLAAPEPPARPAPAPDDAAALDRELHAALSALVAKAWERQDHADEYDRVLNVVWRRELNAADHA